MRVSCREDDPGFGIYAEARSIGLRPHVFVDGVEVPRCFTADTDEGSVYVYDEDESGKPYLNAERTAAVEKTLRGIVTVEMVRE